MVNIGNIGESDVSLKKSVVEEARDFLPNEKEFRGRHEQQVVLGELFAANGTLITVPEKSTLFITGAWVNILNNSTSSAASTRIIIRGQFILIAQVGNTPTAGLFVTNSIALSYPMPIRLEAGESVSVTVSPAAGTGSAGIIGWIERKEVLTSRPVVAPPQ